VVILLAIGILVWLYSIAHSALPQLDGKVQIPGLSAPVRVIRDGHGIPTIEASTLKDLFFAQGYVTAGDRMWQMDAMRRFAAGELSEVLGDEFLKHDREQRILGLRVAARQTLASVSAMDRLNFEAYAQGVNAYLESHRKRMPIEFRILKYSPRPWSPEDSTLIAAQMTKDLNHGTYEKALTREKILAKLGPELTADLYVNSSWHDRPPTAAHHTLEDTPNDEDDPDSGPNSSVASGSKGETLSISSAKSFDAESDPRLIVGSNNWVVSGAHTITGKPLLSNDMHLGHQMPNLWYEVHLRSNMFDVAGVSLPGMPYVIVGHNQRIAWGFTNIGPTVEDVYVETFNPDGKYLTPAGWKQAEHRQEVIHVKGKPDVVQEDSAQNWTEFRKAFSQLDAPGQNVVYADVDGNIGYQATGKIPIRAMGDGSLPENGSDDRHDWIGYIPYDKMPSVFNPVSGIVATANGRIVPDGYPYSISVGWEAPWRTARIYRVLESGKKFSTADMLALQTDIYSEYERYTADRFVYAVDHARKPSARAKQAAEIMRGWDGRMMADSAAPTLAYRARSELVRLLLEPKLGAAPPGPQQPGDGLNWKSYSWGMQSIWLENILLHQPQRWLPENYPNYEELLTAAVEAAVSDTEAPQELGSWKWGQFRPVEIQHPILGQIPILKNWTGPGVKPQSGSGYTVKAVTRSHGPSERMTVNLADLDQSSLNLVTGEAGNFLSPYYMDQWPAWYEGFTFTLPFSKAAVENSRSHEVLLEPR
jgi:penicillin amidase